jgi:SPP1 family predicted phage head-tail adaptor
MIPGPRTVLTLQSKTDTSDSAGGFATTWTTISTISGVLTQARGSEQNRTNRTVVYSTHTFFCEKPSSITEKDRFIYDSRVFNIVMIRNPGNMNHHLEIDLLEVV